MYGMFFQFFCLALSTFSWFMIFFRFYFYFFPSYFLFPNISQKLYILLNTYQSLLYFTGMQDYSGSFGINFYVNIISFGDTV